MKTIQTLSLLSMLVYLVSCGSTSHLGVDPEVLLAGPKPAWLIQQPVDPNYYFGVGSAAKNTYGSEAQRSAQDMALADLASQTTVKITSDIVTTLIENGNLTQEDYLATARSQAIAELEGHELVDTWQDAHYQYAFYRLSKAQYAAVQARKRQAALALSTEFLSQAQAAWELSHFSASFQATIQAFIPLLPYLNEALEVTINGQSLILSNAVHAQLQELLSGIGLTPNKTSTRAKLGQAISEKLTVSAKDSQGRPLQDLPLKVRFKKGAGELVESVNTGQGGLAPLQISNITSPLKLQLLEVSVDRQQLLRGIESLILTGIIKSIPLSSTRIILDVVSPTIYLESSETFNGLAVKQLQIEPRIKNHFIVEGFHFVENSQEADWHMTLQATASEGTEYSGLYTTFADVSLNVVDLKSGREIYKHSVQRVKGIDLNYSNAANKAFNHAADEMISNILPQIMGSIK